MPLQLKYADKIHLQKGSVLALIQGKNVLGQNFFCYMITNESPLRQLSRDMENSGIYDVRAYGTVIHEGKGIPQEKDRIYAEKRSALCLGQI